MGSSDHEAEIDRARPRCFDPVREARSLMRDAGAGILSTWSLAEHGYPYGSVARYVLTVDRRPALRLQAIAQHALNIGVNPRVCLTVANVADTRSPSMPRVTLIGDANPVPEARLNEVSELYFSTFPQHGTQPSRGHGFFWIDPIRLRYCGSRGETFWIATEEWFALAPS